MVIGRYATSARSDSPTRGSSRDTWRSSTESNLRSPPTQHSGLMPQCQETDPGSKVTLNYFFIKQNLFNFFQISLFSANVNLYTLCDVTEWACDRCQKTFKRKDNLLRHQRHSCRGASPAAPQPGPSNIPPQARPSNQDFDGSRQPGNYSFYFILFFFLA